MIAALRAARKEANEIPTINGRAMAIALNGYRQGEFDAEFTRASLLCLGVNEEATAKMIKAFAPPSALT